MFKLKIVRSWNKKACVTQRLRQMDDFPSTFIRAEKTIISAQMVSGAKSFLI